MRMSSQALHSRNIVEKAHCKTLKITKHVMDTKDEEMGEQQPRRSSDKICLDGVVTASKKDGRELEFNGKLQRGSGMPEKPATDSTSSDEMLRGPDIRELAVDSTSTEEAWISAT